MDLSRIKDTKDLKPLLDLMGQYNLVELEVSGEGRTIRLRKAEGVTVAREVPPGALIAVEGAPAVPAPEAVDGSSTEPNSSKIREVQSPMVGTFYRAASPEAEAFVKEGDRVEDDTVVCIIEAMKVMNEIPTGIAGIVREALVKNGESVEFGQPLFRIEVE